MIFVTTNSFQQPEKKHESVTLGRLPSALSLCYSNHQQIGLKPANWQTNRSEVPQAEDTCFTQ